MTGILLILIAVAWLALLIMLTAAGAGRIQNASARPWIAVIFFLAVLPLPLADEIIARYQFKARCQNDAVLIVDTEKIKGRRVKLVYHYLDLPVRGLWVPATYSRLVYIDASTGEPLASYGSLTARGGWLIRALGISETKSPLLIDPKYCSPNVGEEDVARRYEFQIVH